MKLSFDNNGGSKSPIFVTEAEVVSVHSRDKEEQGNYPKDISLEVKVKVKKQDDSTFEKKFWIDGNFGKNGWGSAFPVRDFVKLTIQDDLNKDAQEELLDDLTQGNLPPVFAEKAVGKVITILDAVKGTYGDDNKPSYRTWNIVRKAGYDAERMKQEFIDANNKRVEAGYAPLYTPEVLELQNAEKVSEEVPVEDFKF